MRIIQNVGLALSMFLTASCTQQSLMPPSEKDKNESSNTSGDEDIVLEEEAPEDSTGATVSVSLDMNSSEESGLALVEGADTDAAVTSTDATAADPEPAVVDTSKKISDAISLDIARFNLWAIKVKAKKDSSNKEKDLDKIEIKEDSDDEKILEADDEDNIDAEKADKDDDKVTDQKDKIDAENEVGVELKNPDMMAGAESAKKDDHIQGNVIEERDHHQKKQEDDQERDKKRDHSRRFHGPYIYDAIAGKMEGDAPKVDLNDGSYRRIEFKLKRNVTAVDTDPILGNVFVIRGTYTKPGSETGVAFAIDWHSAMNFRLKGDSAFKVEAEGDTKLSIVFDMGKWFDGVDMSAAEVGADGVIYINKKSNRPIMKQLRKNIKMNCRFGNDKNKDGKLSADETAGRGEDAPDAEGE